MSIQSQNNHAQEVSFATCAWYSFLGLVLLLIVLAVVFLLNREKVDVAVNLLQAFLRAIRSSPPVMAGELINGALGLVALALVLFDTTVELGLRVLYQIATMIGATRQRKELDIPASTPPHWILGLTFLYFLLSLVCVFFFFFPSGSQPKGL